MRIIALASALCLSSLVSAQVLTIGTLPNNQGNPGGGLYFNLKVLVPITITELNFGIGSNTAAGAACNVDIYLGPSTYEGNVTNPGLWTKVASTFPYTKVGAATYEVAVGAAVVPEAGIAALTLCPGDYGVVLQAVGCNHGYTTGVGCTGAQPPGSCPNALATNSDLEFRGGQAQNAFLSGGVFSPRIFTGEIVYTTSIVGPCLEVAAREGYGQGCYDTAQSVYEYFPNPGGLDVANTSLYFTYDGVNNRYDVTLGTTPITPPISTALNLGADGEVLLDTATGFIQPILYPGTLTTEVASQVSVNADGHVVLEGSRNALWVAANIVPDLFDPSLVTPLGAATPASIGFFKSLDPTLAGGVHFDYDLANAVNLFTWNGVADTGAVAAINTYQIAFFSTGDFELRFEAMSVGGGGGNPAVIGFFLNNQAGYRNAGSTDLNAGAGFSTGTTDQFPLAIEADSNPVLGSTVMITTSDFPAPAVGITIFSTSPATGSPIPPIDLALLGAPGCWANVATLDVTTAIDNLGANGPTVGFPIPANPILAGIDIGAQSAVLAPLNALGIVTSSGLLMNIGL